MICPRCGLDYEPADGPFTSKVHNGIHRELPAEPMDEATPDEDRWADDGGPVS